MSKNPQYAKVTHNAHHLYVVDYNNTALTVIILFPFSGSGYRLHETLIAKLWHRSKMNLHTHPHHRSNVHQTDRVENDEVGRNTLRSQHIADAGTIRWKFNFTFCLSVSCALHHCTADAELRLCTHRCSVVPMRRQWEKGCSLPHRGHNESDCTVNAEQ